jgi:hypothetical protein
VLVWRRLFNYLCCAFTWTALLSLSRSREVLAKFILYMIMPISFSSSLLAWTCQQRHWFEKINLLLSLDTILVSSEDIYLQLVRLRLWGSFFACRRHYLSNDFFLCAFRNKRPVAGCVYRHNPHQRKWNDLLVSSLIITLLNFTELKQSFGHTFYRKRYIFWQGPNYRAHESFDIRSHSRCGYISVKN